MLKWLLTRRFRKDRAPTPDFPVATPAFVRPRAAEGTLTATWVGHATVLLQLGSRTVLTDPMWSARASPLPMLGPRRVVRPGIPFDELPAVDLVVLSHNHYDHLDARTVRRLARRYPEAPWVAPLGLRDWLRDHGVRDAWEIDWWDQLRVNGVSVTALPARHFSGRGLRDRMATLWCGWAIEAEGWRVLFAGDTADHPEWETIAVKAGPFDVALIPVGAYEPRWIMQPVHLNPAEAVDGYGRLLGTGESGMGNGGDRGAGGGRRGGPPTGNLTARRPHPVMLPIHWGTFELTDEPLDEPPVRTRQAWEAAGLDPGDLWIMQHGETRTLTRG